MFSIQHSHVDCDLAVSSVEIRYWVALIGHAFGFSIGKSSSCSRILMALTTWLAAGGQLIASHFEQQDNRSLLHVESKMDDLHDHIIIYGFRHVGQMLSFFQNDQFGLLLLIERVAVGRALDLPVYFGDAGNREVLHKIGAERASGATAVVPETLAKLPMSEIAATINEFRSQHLSEPTEEHYPYDLPILFETYMDGHNLTNCRTPFCGSGSCFRESCDGRGESIPFWFGSGGRR
ncbi:hypothetical protein MLD38_036409 [Melastoma candidum]|uniref:Uncharacterized protein n=1 Tax=Melastoma candidum TaxID=119954 RepID=A0ACB9LKB2_9MYRT|nr:hypothetical protein MLD38_036409 [Melastoma candidum]